MNKNTIWFVISATLIILLSWVVLPAIFPSLRVFGRSTETVAESTENPESENSVQELEVAELSSFDADSTSSEDSEFDSSLVEQTFTVNTNFAEIILTNKGGDIISYKLTQHEDIETKTGVQLADNVNKANRAFALSIGQADKAITDKIFAVEKIDDYTYFFKQNLIVNGRKVMVGKKYTFMPDEYMFKLDIFFHDDSGTGIDFDGASYTIRTSPQIGPHYYAKRDKYENRSFLAFNGKKVKKINVGSNNFSKYEKNAVWTGIGGKYFIEVVIPAKAENVKSYYYSSKIEVDDYANAQSFIERKAFTGSDIQDSYFVYYGPRNETELKRYNVAENNGWAIGGYRLNEGLQTYDWLKWLEKVLQFILKLINKLVHNWGVSIIILTLLLRFAMFPLSKKQSFGTLKMQELQPKLKAIQEKYKDDQQKLQQETQKVYQAAGYNPASGCLPMIIQMLILFAMFDMFNNYFEFRGASFIPGWIPDLSRGDHIATLKFTIPVLRTDEIRLLPIIYVFTQLISGKITQNGGMSSGNAQSQLSMKIMTYGMPIFFFFIFYSAPAGLILYWTVSNAFQIFQQIIINRMMKAKREEMSKGGETANKVLPPKAKKNKK